MLVAGPRGAGKSEFVKQLLFLKCYTMRDAPERIFWFYGRHQPDLFCSLTQEIPAQSFTKVFLRILKSCLTEVNVTFVSLMISCRVRVEISWSKTSLLMELILCRKGMQSHLFEFNLHRGFQESKRSNPNSSSSMSNVPIQTKILTSSLRRRNKRSLSVFVLRFSSQFTRICKGSWKYFPM